MVRKIVTQKFADGFYFVCPECHAITQHGVRALFTEDGRYEMEFSSVKIKYRRERHGDEIVYMAVTHDEHCGPIEGDPADFVVYIENNRITRIGEYWQKHFNELKEIASEHALLLAETIDSIDPNALEWHDEY